MRFMIQIGLRRPMPQFDIADISKRQDAFIEQCRRRGAITDHWGFASGSEQGMIVEIAGHAELRDFMRTMPAFACFDTIEATPLASPLSLAAAEQFGAL